MKPKFSKNNVEQTIDLKEAFGVSFKGRPSLREAIGGAILERIKERTKSGDSITIDERGRGFIGKLTRI